MKVGAFSGLFYVMFFCCSYKSPNLKRIKCMFEVQWRLPEGYKQDTNEIQADKSTRETAAHENPVSEKTREKAQKRAKRPLLFVACVYSVYYLDQRIESVQRGDKVRNMKHYEFDP